MLKLTRPKSVLIFCLVLIIATLSTVFVVVYTMQRGINGTTTTPNAVTNMNKNNQPQVTSSDGSKPSTSTAQPSQKAGNGTTPTPAAATSNSGTGTQATQSATPTPTPAPDTIQVNEQFAGSSLNASLWDIISYPKGYRNHEEQDYIPSQVKVENGTLQLTAVKDGNGDWHSGEVHSKWAYTYGEFEVRMSVSATGPGVWPAAWLMGNTDQWPDNGEIDIIENINGGTTAYGTLHGGGSSGHWQLAKSYSPIDITAYNTYKIVKKPGVISWYINGVKRGEWLQSQTPAGGIWPFESHSNFGLLNLAIGGDWPGPTGPSTPSSITLFVDYFTVKNAY